jgi:hypothetical protein
MLLKLLGGELIIGYVLIHGMIHGEIKEHLELHLDNVELIVKYMLDMLDHLIHFIIINIIHIY